MAEKNDNFEFPALITGFTQDTVEINCIFDKEKRANFETEFPLNDCKNVEELKKLKIGTLIKLTKEETLFTIESSEEITNEVGDLFIEIYKN